MFTIPAVILYLILVVAIFAAIFWAIVNRRRYQLNMQVATDLDTLIKSTRELFQKHKNIGRFGAGATESSTQAYDLNSPTMLATLITCLVNKYGDTRLSIKDFVIPDEEYVSVYVDTRTQEIILSLNHHYAGDGVEEPYSMVNFSDPDDTTFH
jgi:hypothetical protein